MPHMNRRQAGPDTIPPKMTQHTPGPLTKRSQNHQEAFGADGSLVASTRSSTRMLSEIHNNLQRLIACWNACMDIEDPETEIKRLKRYDEPEMKCNKGHVTLPLKLWDCPACTEELRREKAELLEHIILAHRCLLQKATYEAQEELEAAISKAKKKGTK